MQQALTLVLLPGLDGSGVMFEPLLQSLPAGMSVKVVALSDFPTENRQEQAAALARELGDMPSVIYAESYSGRLAYELAQLGKVDIRHIIFAGSFLGKPSGRAHKAKYLPVWVIKSTRVPIWLASRFLFGRYQPDLVKLLHRAMATQPTERLKQRLVNLAEAQDPVAPLAVSCTYVQATDDALVDPEALEAIERVCPHLDIQRFEGCHFMAQTRPVFCRDLIARVWLKDDHRITDHRSPITDHRSPITDSSMIGDSRTQ